MRFMKMHGTGNDFVVVADGAPSSASAEGSAPDWSAAAARLCDRHFGIGSDGVLLVLPSGVAAFRMQMFNPDGSESEMCGNGIRCVTKYAVETGLAAAAADGPSGTGIRIETRAGIKTVWPVLGPGGSVHEVRVDMEPPELSPRRVPVAVGNDGDGPVLDHGVAIDGAELALSFVSMGNPHAVAFLDDPVDDFPLDRTGPKVEHDRLFPNRANFEVANVLARDRLRVRVWERGAGLTMACGTGACAVMVAARLKGLVGDSATVELPGGNLFLEWDGAGPVYMTGPVETVFEGEWSGPL